MVALGFVGSFGHCVGMCGPLSVAFSLSSQRRESEGSTTEGSTTTENAAQSWRSQLQFHGLLNLGRLASYSLVGALIGSVGSAVAAGSQWVGVGSPVRQGVSILTGILLIWFGLAQIKPNWIPKIPILHPLSGTKGHQRINQWFDQFGRNATWFQPALIGLLWGSIPCGFLYAAQLKALETSGPLAGAITLFAFGLGTLPVMIGVGATVGQLGSDRRSQLFRLGGWITLIVGGLTLLRTGQMVDHTGHCALLCLMLALLARPIANLWAAPLKYRRAIGVAAYILAIAHCAHMFEHSFEWQWQAILFLPPSNQWGIWSGAIALILMTPAALTSFDWAQKKLGQTWRHLHLLSLPALIFAASHTIFSGSSYLGQIDLAAINWTRTSVVTALASIVLGLRWWKPKIAAQHSKNQL